MVYFYRPLCLLLFILTNVFSYGQICTIGSSNDVCLGNNISFIPQFSSGSPLNYFWDFGDGNSSLNQNPLHIYSKVGTFQVSLVMEFSNNNSCTAIKTITVHDLPKAKFSIDEAKKNVCLYNNNICIQDLSVPSKSANPIKKRTFLWGDGGGQIDSNNNVNNKINCYSYHETGTYKLLMEIADNKGCLSKDSQTVTILPDVQAKFTVDYKINNKKDCKDLVCFYNKSKIDSSFFDKHYWILGNQAPFSNNYDSFCKLYDSAGVFPEKLVLQNKNGCKDTFTLPIDIRAKPINIDITIPDVVCVGTIQDFTNKGQNPNAYQTWQLADSATLFGKTDTGFSVVYELFTPGKYYIEYKIQKYGCEKTYKDSIEVIGPNARFELLNGYQCSLTDSVIFCDYSDNGYKAYNVVRRYDFTHGDSCHTDILSGKNLYRNCRYSNEYSTKHWYQADDSSESIKCYNPALTLTDTLTGCSSTWTGSVIIGKPDAQSIGLTHEVKYPCEDATSNNRERKYKFYLSIPLCQDYWEGELIYDSAKGLKTDILSGNVPDQVSYNNIIDPEGYVTIGVIIFNGYKDFYKNCDTLDRYSRSCYDTVWFHNYMKVLPEPKAIFDLKEEKFCVPQELEFVYLNKIQYGLSSVFIDFGDGFTQSVTFSDKDSVLPTFKHKYMQPGEYRVYSLLKNQAICDNSFAKDIRLGYFNEFTVDSLVCMGDTVEFNDSIRYPNDTLAYWRDSLRNALGMEKVLWDFDDGAGFHVKGPKPKYVFKDTGVFYVKMLSVDSMGCQDTFVSIVRVIGLNVNIYIEKDTFICNDNIVRFYDSTIFPSFFANDSISSRIWDFDGDIRYLQNPFYDYNTFGLKNIKLTIKTKSGCESSANKTILIKGPTPHYLLLTDSIGCVPLTVSFKNLSGIANNYIWYSGDNSGITFNTDTLVDFDYTYKTPGVYSVKLVSTDSVFNPLTGNMDFCTDSTTLQQIIVQRIPKVDFEMPEKVCKGETFTIRSLADTLYTQHIYFIGTTDTLISSGKTQDYVFYRSGNFDFWYKPVYLVDPPYKECFDSAFKSIYVPPITARFTVNPLTPPYYQFENTSLDAVRYKWDFGDYASKDNYSEDISPIHNYQNRKGTFLICLIAYNELDCPDTTCANLENYFEPYIFIPNVFTPGGKDTANNRFDIDCVGELSYHLKIYNRWGELVFTSDIDGIGNTDVNNWDGTKFNQGIECPSGEYFVVFEYQLNGYDQKQYKGTATLIRDGR